MAAETSQNRFEVWADRLKTISYGGSAALLVVYVAGFLIVTLYQSRFGVVRFDLLRPRILSAGSGFALLLAMTALTALRLRRQGEGKLSGDKAMFWLVVSRGFVTLFSDALAVPTAEHWTFRMVAACVASVACLILSATVLPAGPWRRALGQAAWLAFLGIGFFAMSTPVKWMWIWIAASGFAVVYVEQLALREDLRSSFSYPVFEAQVILIPLMLVGTYAATLYGNLPVKLGGGFPTPVRIFLSEELPDGIGKLKEGGLIDETEDGYYLTNSDGALTATFIPRNTVRLVEFVGTRAVQPTSTAGTTPTAPVK